MAAEQWAKMLDTIANTAVDASAVNTYLRPLQPKLKDNVFYLLAPNAFVKNYVCDNYYNVIQKQLDEIIINSIYDYEKITSLFKNFDTLSFLDLIVNYDKFIKDGYNKIFLNSSLHAMLSMPFFLTRVCRVDNTLSQI